MLSRKNVGLFAVAAAILVVGLAFAGKSLGPWVFTLALLACPLMMIFMMRGMHDTGSGGREKRSRNTHSDNDERLKP